MRFGPRICVIGGGPAGLMAAETLASGGSVNVTVQDRMPSVGRKLLMAGRGGLNLTHSEPLDRFARRYGMAEPWLAPSLDVLPPASLIAWADELGASTFVGSSGRVFPRAMKASPLLRAWLGRLQGLGVSLSTGSTWTGFDPATGHPTFLDADGTCKARPADAVILALGGASWPRLGSNGAWVEPLAALGVDIAALAPANAGLTIAWSPHMARAIGEPLKRIAVTAIGSVRASAPQIGEAVITATGLEGGAIYAISSQVREGLTGGAAMELRIDLRPDLPVDALAARLAKAAPKRSLATRLLQAAGLSPAAIAVLREGFAGGALPRDAGELACAIKAVRLPVTGIGGLDRAISTAGGVKRGAVDDHLMLKALPGVFAAGEMLDWEAPTGGYLLQATFATAVTAAHGARSWLAAGHRLGQHGGH